MSVVANIAVNVDSSNAVSKLKQVQQGAQATSQAVDKLNATNDALAASFAKSGKPIQTAANGMRFFTDATGRARKENGQFVTTAEAAAAGLKKQGIAAQQTAGKLNGLRNAVVGLGSAFGGIAAVLGVIQAGRFVFAKTAEVESQTRSLQVLTGSAEKAGQIIKQLQDLGAVTPFTSTELIDAAKRLQAFGVEADKVVETTRRLADASGATGAELSGLVTAYGQVQAKGRLQGEELLQFQERGIALQEELRKMYGMTGEEFQKALEKGQISAKAVEVALVNLTNTGGKYANGAIAQSDTLSGRLSTLQDNVDGVAREVGKVLTPALIGILQQLNTSLSQTPAFVEDIALAFQYAAGQIAPFLNGLSQMQWFFTNLTPPGWAMQVIGGASERGKSTIRGAASRQRQSIKNSFIGPAAPQMQGPAVPERLRQQKNETPPLMVATGGKTGGTRKGKSDAERAAEKAAEEAKRLAEQIRQQTKAAESLKIQQQGSLAILRSSNDFEKAFVEFSVKRTEIQRRYSELTLASKSDEERKLLTEARALEFKQSSFELQKQITELTKQATAPLDDVVSKLKDQVAFEREYGELIKNGTNPELAKQIIEINRAYEASAAALVPALAAAQAAVTKAEAEGASATQIQKYREELERIQAIQSGLPAKKADAVGAATELAKPKGESQKIEERLGKVKDELKELTSLSYQVTQGAEMIGKAFSQSFMGLISGSMTAKEALASFFKSVSDHFMDMASQMIAKMIEMFILQTILGIAGSAAGSGGGFTASGAGFGGSNSFSTFNAGGATAFGNPAFMAEGGFVTGPTSAVIGEGGESEYVIPASKMQSAMSRYSRGARGEGVIAGSGGGTEGGGATAAAGPMVVDVRYSVERINDVEYVTASAFQAGMRQAAQQGAAQGEQRTLRRLQQSPGTRKRVGM